MATNSSKQRRQNKSIFVLLGGTLIGLSFWMIDGLINFYCFSSKLRTMMFQEPLNLLDSLIFEISPYALYTRLAFLSACVIGSVTIAIYINKLHKAEESLIHYSKTLEEMVEERTSELKAAQAELIQQEKLAITGKLATMVGHEIRDPLSIIANAIYFLKTIPGSLNDQEKEYYDIISDEIEIASLKINELIEYAQKTSPIPISISLHTLIDEAFERIISPKDFKKEISIPDDLPDLYVDADQIIFSLTSMLIMCNRAIKTGGILALSAQEHDEAVLINFKITFSKFMKQHIKNIFKPMTTCDTIGNNLYLVMTRDYIKANNGTISIDKQLDDEVLIGIHLPLNIRETDLHIINKQDHVKTGLLQH